MPLQRLLLAMFLLLPWLVQGQSSLLSQEVSLSFSNSTLEAALDRLSQEYRVSISFSDDHVPLAKPIDLVFHGSLENALKQLLSDTGLGFQLIGEQIVLIPAPEAETHSVVLSGLVKDALTGEDLIGVIVKVQGTGTAAVTNNYGFYSLTLPRGKYDLIYSYLGYEPYRQVAELHSDLEQDVDLTESALQLNELVIESDLEANVVHQVGMNSLTLNVQSIKQRPALLGEADIVQNLLLVPGVQSVGEGKTGLYVRGGTADQTLIQLDEAMIFNAFHIGGLFSVFNPDALKDVKLHKGSAPVQYGGRLSSVLDVRMKEGNRQKFSARGGIGTVSSRLSLEGPLTKSKKGSYIISGRRTYLDLLLGLSSDTEVNGNDLFFYDVNGKFNYSINDKNRIFASSYIGRDVFRLKDDVSLKWGNFISTLRWNHLFNSRLFLNTTLLYSNFSYGFSLADNLVGVDWSSSLRNYSLKTDFYYYVDPSLEIDFGYSMIWHHFQPANIVPVENHASFEPVKIPTENALEQGVYGAVKKKFSEKLEIDLGVRLSIFQNFGPGQYFIYADGLPKANENIVDTLDASSFELIKTYFGFEPRLNVRWLINNTTSVKAAYSRNKQYMHVMATNTVGFPTDRYKPSNPNLAPQTSDQLSLGVFKSIYGLTWSVESYYRSMRNLAQINNDPNAIISNTLEQKVFTGKGWSYGLELSVRKETGQTTGWISYTWSRAWNKLANLNGGLKFHPFYDRTHDINLALSHSLNKRITLSANWIFTSGQALSLPIGKYELDDKTVPLFDDNNLNGSRGPNYHRLDLSIAIKGKNKKNRRWQGSWNIAFYNLYFRKNIIAYQYRDVINGDTDFSDSDKGLVVESREFKAVGSYLFQFVPSVTYNFKF